jgi:hypothetical protein
MEGRGTGGGGREASWGLSVTWTLEISKFSTRECEVKSSGWRVDT